MSITNLFGTDGVRGKTNEFPMEPEVIVRLGLAAGQYFRNHDKRHKVILGKDTRISGYIFETALTSGLCASGMDVYLVGPMPTPAISFLTRNMRADLGIVISASHNPYMDNGIKFFDRNGFKISDEAEKKISEMVLNKNIKWNYPEPDKVGRAHRIVDSLGRYVVYLKNTFPQDLSLDGIKIVLDCANGATYRCAPLVFEELGAEVIKIGVSPNGTNINERCGALYPEKVKEEVIKTGADIGIALDGDGDRVIIVDEKGNILDGDQLIAIFAKDLFDRGLLDNKKVVVTVMSNMGLENFIKDELGLDLIRTPVGDRFVVEKMREVKAVIGGEQSGHIIFLNYSTTGDGILAALQVLRIMLEKNKPLSELKGLITLYPQKLINIKVREKRPLNEIPEVQRAIKEVDSLLNGKGRHLIRYSGTEPVIRIMVEARDKDLIENSIEILKESITKTIGEC